MKFISRHVQNEAEILDIDGLGACLCVLLSLEWELLPPYTVTLVLSIAELADQGQSWLQCYPPGSSAVILLSV